MLAKLQIVAGLGAWALFLLSVAVIAIVVVVRTIRWIVRWFRNRKASK